MIWSWILLRWLCLIVWFCLWIDLFFFSFFLFSLLFIVFGNLDIFSFLMKFGIINFGKILIRYFCSFEEKMKVGEMKVVIDSLLLLMYLWGIIMVIFIFGCWMSICLILFRFIFWFWIFNMLFKCLIKVILLLEFCKLWFFVL